MLLILIGLSLTALTVAIHAAGTAFWVQYLVAHYRGSGGCWPVRAILGVLMSTAVVMLLLHVVEVGLWAGAYLIFVPGELQTYEEALYFSFVTFTSLGYGDITLGSEWRLLSGIESLSGLLVAGISTALLFTVLQRAWGLQHASSNVATKRGDS
jgi:voltage-gated potassium channel